MNHFTTSPVDTASDEGFKFKDVILNDVVLAVSHFKSQAIGTDGITHKITAKTLPPVGPFLVKLFNESLVKEVFLPSLKSSSIYYKSSNLYISFWFQTIAPLYFLSKVLKKLVHDQIAALLRLVVDIRLGMSKKLITILLQFNFSKAFDSMPPFKFLR